MSSLLPDDPLVFLLFTVGIVGGAGYMAGQAVAATWRPLWQAVAYGLLLGLANRFFVYALFDGALLSVSGLLKDTAVIIMICLIGFRVTQVSKIVAQYPWLYERAGYFNLRSKGG